MSDEGTNTECDIGGGSDEFLQLRIASIFIIMVGSMGATLFPVLAKRSSWLKIPEYVFDFAKYFGSGVIIATAFIHLLSPGLDALSSPYLDPAWSDYPYALALAMLSIFIIFIVELVAFRWGTSKLASLGVVHDTHGHQAGGNHLAHGPEGVDIERPPLEAKGSHDSDHSHLSPKNDNSGLAQIIGVFILEFGVVLHSVLIGLTLAVDPDFKVLFVVLVFHQSFEGLGLGSRLAFLRLPPRYNYVPILGAVIYGLTTPIGIAAGLGVRTTYNPGTAIASIVSGTMDSLSAGILIYTGLVELLAHEFLFNKEMINASNSKIAYALGCMLLGVAIMSLLGRWA